MQDEVMTIDSIAANMREPWKMPPAQIVQSYMFLSSIFGQKTLEFIEADAKAGEVEAKYLSEDMTSAKAKTLLKASPEGKNASRLRGELKAIEEMTKALKRAQQYYSEEAQGRY
jgi:hypothetical protein